MQEKLEDLPNLIKEEQMKLFRLRFHIEQSKKKLKSREMQITSDVTGQPEIYRNEMARKAQILKFMEQDDDCAADEKEIIEMTQESELCKIQYEYLNNVFRVYEVNQMP